MRLFLIILLSLSVDIVFAKTIFEPSISLGSGSGSVSRTDSVLAGQSGDGQGFVGSVGFRYGITRRYIHVTGILEGHFVTGGSADTGTPTSTIESDSALVGYAGLGIGYEWNIPLRTYVMLGAYEFDTDLFALGLELSYSISDSMWLGLRYSNLQANVQGSFTNVPDTARIDYNAISVTMSFPIEFNYPDHWFRKTDWQ
jgi:hypothetical protein